MVDSIARSRWLTLGLAVALVISLGLHLAAWIGEDAESGPHVLRVARAGPARQPTLEIDFDTPMVAPEALNTPLPDGLVRLDPPVALSARFITTHRLEVRVERPLPLFQHARVIFGSGFSDAAGRPVHGREDVEFTTGRLELSDAVQARFDADGRAICALEFNGPVSPNVLKAHLTLTDRAGRDLAYDLKGKDDSWELHLARAPRDGAILRLTAGLCSRLGPAGFLDDVTSSVSWSTTLRVIAAEVSGDHPRRDLELTFSHVLADTNVASFVDVEPRPDDLTIRTRGPHLFLTGTFPPRRIVHVRLKKGLAALAGMRLARDVVRPMQIPAPAARVRIAQSGSTLSTAARPEILIEGINVPVVEVTLREVYPNNIVPLALGWARASRLGGAPLEVRVPIDAAADEPWTHAIDLDDILGKAPRGVYHLTVRNPQSYWGRSGRLLQVTDLAPVVRATPRGMVVFVSRLSDGTPVEGARIEARDKKNQPCASGVTDAAGLFLAPTLTLTPTMTASMTATPFVVTVTTDTDRAWVDVSTHAIAHAPKDIEGRSTPDGLEAYVYADRGVVRPGETARLTAITRAPNGTAGAAGLPLSIRVRAPNRRIVKRFTRRTDTHGVATLDLPFTLDAPAGPYVAEVHAPGRDDPIGTVSFRVEAIVPDRLEPILTLGTDDLEPGSTLAVTLAAKLLNGDPIGGLRARLRVRYAPMLGAGRDGFTFGDRFAAPAPFSGPEVPCVLDAEGTAVARVELPEITSAGLSLRVTFELEVIDVSGRAAFTRLERRLVPNGPRLALSRPGNGPLAFTAKLEGGQATSGRAVLERVRSIGSWHFEGSRMVWRGEELANPMAEVAFTLEDGTAHVQFADPGNGRFRLRIQAEGARPAALGFERWGGETTGPSPAGSPRLAVALIGGAVVPGAKASLAVDAPVAGRALLTVETQMIHHASVVDLIKGPQRLEVEIPEVAAPNVHVSLTLVAGIREMNGRPARLLGAVAVPLERPARRLGVTLAMPPQVEPESELTLDIQTSAPATLRVHVVDEGLLRLTGHLTPDPRARLEATRRLDTRLADIYASLLEGMRFGGDDAEAGGGANLATRLDPTAKKTIETVALASELVHCEGHATVRFKLPPYEGRLRVFVVAAGAEGTGGASRPLIVKGPISIAIHVPRAVAPGDVFDVPLQVKGEAVAFDLDLRGLERLGQGELLRVRAGTAPGLASITVRARDGHGNRMERTVRFSIRPAAPFTVTHEVLRIAAGERLDKEIPGTWLPGHATAHIVVGNRPGLETLPALERLLEYPHGCIEQTTSRGFSVLAWSELLRATHPEGLAPEDVVAAAIDRVLSMQTADGGLSFWPGGGDTYDFGSAYGAHFLLAAKGMGRMVPKEPLKALLDNLEKRLRRNQADAYTARVLAVGGRSVAAHLERLIERATTAEAKADLAAAFALSGNGSRARTLLGDARDPWAAPREQGGRLSSPVRSAATLLGALLVVTPTDARIPDLAARLHATLRADRQTTQDGAAALLALARFHAQRAAEPPSAGRLTLGAKDHTFEGDGLRLDFDPTTTPRFALEAKGPTTLMLRIAGIPLAPRAGSVERGMKVTRHIEAPDGPLKQGQVYRVVIQGTLPRGSQNLLVTDVLPGGLEIEAARNQEGTLEPDRTEPRDDRVLFFRTQGLSAGTFRQTYLVRAVTVGTFQKPPVSAELLYAPDIHARSGGGGTLEIVR